MVLSKYLPTVDNLPHQLRAEPDRFSEVLV
jgi:hypothetical protein